MLTKAEIVETLKALVADGRTSQTDIGKVIGKPQPRIAELFKGARDLSLDEAVKLVDAYGLEPDVLPNEALLEDMLKDIQQTEIPATLPFSEWPRIVASALHTRLELHAKYFPNRVGADYLPADAPAEVAPPRAPTRPTAPE